MSQVAIVLILLGTAVSLMLADVLRADLVAICLAVVLALVGVLSPAEAFCGLSSAPVVTLLAVFILTTGLYRTGVTRRVGTMLQRLAGESFNRLLVLSMLGGAFLAFFMNNIAAAAVLMPALTDVARRTKRSPSKLLMPLAFAVNLGGMATLLGTSNILVSSALAKLGEPGFGLLDFVPVGLPVLAVGVLYTVAFGHRLLPESGLPEKFRNDVLPTELRQTYALEERMRQVRVPTGSPLSGRTIAESGASRDFGLSVLAVVQRGRTLRAPNPQLIFEPGDVVVLAGRAERVDEFVNAFGAEPVERVPLDNALCDSRVTLVEAVVPPRSQTEGKTLQDMRFRDRFGLSVVALWQGGRPRRTDVGQTPLHFGDGLLIYGPVTRLPILQESEDFLVLTDAPVPILTGRGWLSVGILAATLVIVAVNLVPVHLGMMLGAVAMLISGCLSMDEAYRSVEWRAVFVVAGMLSGGSALVASGAAEWIAQRVVLAVTGMPPIVLVGGMLVLATVLSQVMSGQVTAVVLTPVAIVAAQQLGANPRAIAMAVAVGCSTVFLTPTSHPANVLVMGPGGYRPRDFVRVGLPLTIFAIVIALLVLPVIFPLS